MAERDARTFGPVVLLGLARRRAGRGRRQQALGRRRERQPAPGGSSASSRSSRRRRQDAGRPAPRAGGAGLLGRRPGHPGPGTPGGRRPRRARRARRAGRRSWSAGRRSRTRCRADLAADRRRPTPRSATPAGSGPRPSARLLSRASPTVLAVRLVPALARDGQPVRRARGARSPRRRRARGAVEPRPVEGHGRGPRPHRLTALNRLGAAPTARPTIPATRSPACLTTTATPPQPGPRRVALLGFVVGGVGLMLSPVSMTDLLGRRRARRRRAGRLRGDGQDGPERLRPLTAVTRDPDRRAAAARWRSRPPRRLGARSPRSAGSALGTLALHLRDPHASGSWGFCPFAPDSGSAARAAAACARSTT